MSRRARMLIPQCPLSHRITSQPSLRNKKLRRVPHPSRVVCERVGILIFHSEPSPPPLLLLQEGGDFELTSHSPSANLRPALELGPERPRNSLHIFSSTRTRGGSRL